MDALELAARSQLLMEEGVSAQLYLFDFGFMYAGPWVYEESTTRYAVTMILSLDGTPFEYEAQGALHSTSGVLFGPFVPRRLLARHTPIVSIGVTPNHPCYRWFREMRNERGVMELERRDFAALDEGLLMAAEGRLAVHDPADLARAVYQVVMARMVDPGPIDERVQRVIEMVMQRPHVQLDELAQDVGLSYDRLSHLFSEDMGLPLRSYALAQKIHRASQWIGRARATLTDIGLAAGFADSAHFSRVWVRTFGASPSAFYSRRSIKVHNSITPMEAFPSR